MSIPPLPVQNLHVCMFRFGADHTAGAAALLAPTDLPDSYGGGQGGVQTHGGAHPAHRQGNTVPGHAPH